MLRRPEIQQRMNAAGNCYDNAFMESCFGTIKTELELVEYRTPAEALRELTSYIRYYNVERFHSSLGYDPPAQFETEPKPQQQDAGLSRKPEAPQFKCLNPAYSVAQPGFRGNTNAS